jgi:hypothetical protein
MIIALSVNAGIQSERVAVPDIDARARHRSTVTDDLEKQPLRDALAVLPYVAAHKPRIEIARPFLQLEAEDTGEALARRAIREFCGNPASG